MSETGQLTRGLKWSLQKDANGDLPEAIRNDAAKMNDVNVYQNFIQTRNKKKVDSLLIYARKLQRDGLKGKQSYKQTMAALKSDGLLDQEKIDALKPVDYSTKTKDELKAILDEQEISYKDTATKDDLLKLLGGI